MTFPVRIAGRRYGSARGLARDIDRRGAHCVLDNPGQSHPAQHFFADSPFEGAIGVAMAEALCIVAAEAERPGALSMALELWQGGPDPTYFRTLLDRTESGRIPGPDAIYGADLLPDLLAKLASPYATQLTDLHPRIDALLERHGRHDLRLGRALSGSDEGAILDALGRCAAEHQLSPNRAATAALELTRKPELLIPAARAMAGQPTEVCDRFLFRIADRLPEWFKAHEDELLRELEV